MLRRVITLLLVAASLSLGQLSVTMPAEAGFSTSGTGPYQESIFWLDWGAGTPGTGSTRTWGASDGLPAGVSLTSTLANVTNTNPSGSDCGTGALSMSFKPMQTWSGATAYRAYNPAGFPAIGDNSACSDYWSVTQDVSMTVNSAAVTPDVVWVDAESTNASTAIRAEDLAVTTNGAAWEDIQDIQGPNATGYWTGASSNSGRTFRLTQTEAPASVPLLVSRGASQVITSSQTGGNQAYAVGILLSYDLGDAPATYGTALHKTAWTDTNIDRTSPNVGPTFFNNTTYLGTQSPDAEYLPGVAWTGDDATNVGIAGPDEGVQQLLGVPEFATLATGATSYSVTVRCTTTNSSARVAGWIDVNRNNAFDSGERAQSACVGNSATLSFSFAALTGAASVGARFRIATTASQVASPIGFASDGEVEDVQIPVANLAVTKTVTPSETVSAGSTVTWTIVITNTGTAPVTGATFVDAVPAGTAYVAGSSTLNGATVGAADFRTVREVRSPGAGSGVIAPGASATVVFKTTVDNDVDRVCNQGTAQFTSSAGAILSDDPSVTGSANPTCVGVRSLDVAKTAGPLTGPDGTGIYRRTYTVTVANAGVATTYGALRDTPQFDPALTVSGATWTVASSSGAAPANGSSTGTGPFNLAPANTAIVQGATHTYTVIVSFRFTATTAASACAGPGTGTYNSVALTVAPLETGPLSNNVACGPPPAPYLPTTSIDVVKRINGQDANTLPGAALAAGSTMAITFEVTNTGQTGLVGVKVTDSVLATPSITCPQTTLAIGATMTCNASLAAPAPGVRHLNVGTASGNPTYSNGTTPIPGRSVSDTDDAHAWTVVAATLPQTGGDMASLARSGAGLLGLLFVGAGLFLARRRETREFA